MPVKNYIFDKGFIELADPRDRVHDLLSLCFQLRVIGDMAVDAAAAGERDRTLRLDTVGRGCEDLLYAGEADILLHLQHLGADGIADSGIGDEKDHLPCPADAVSVRGQRGDIQFNNLVFLIHHNSIIAK